MQKELLNTSGGYMKNNIQITDQSIENSLKVTSDGVLIVQGIEGWIDTLYEVGKINVGKDSFLRMKDNKSGTIFLIRRLK